MSRSGKIPFLVAGLLSLAFYAIPSAPARAADHGDAPDVGGDQFADIADVFFFLDPNDNSRVIVSATVRGFITPGEAVNFGVFDTDQRYRFEIDTTGDVKPDRFIDVTFSHKIDAATGQIATITLPSGRVFQAKCTAATLGATPNPQIITTDRKSQVQFFAGVVDDPFFFDIPAFSRFVASVKAGAPNPAVFQRGRDTFAGYNITAIALSMPKALLVGSSNANIIGLDFLTERKDKNGAFQHKDRMGNPAVNVALVPYARKVEFNHATALDDKAGKFAGDIVKTLQGLGTDQAHINILASVAVTKGDMLHLDLRIPNTGGKSGTNAQAAFPNGRRLADDTIDTLLTIIANGATLGDNVNASDVPPQDQFPFFALPQQPRDPGVVDDNTRN